MSEVDKLIKSYSPAFTMGKKIVERDALIRELVAALEFYADPEVYRPHPDGLAFDRRDLSYSAKAVLAKAKAAGYSP